MHEFLSIELMGVTYFSSMGIIPNEIDDCEPMNLLQLQPQSRIEVEMQFNLQSINSGTSVCARLLQAKINWNGHRERSSASAYN